MREPSNESILAATLAMQPGARTPYRAARDAMQLCALGRRAKRLAEQLCNGIERYDAKAGRYLPSWTDADEIRHERALDRLAVKAREILQPYGATLETVSGDPRGYCLKFRLASGESMGV